MDSPAAINSVVAEEIPYSSPASEEPAVKKPATLDDAKEAGRTVIVRNGVAALRTILDGFKAAKVVDLKPEQLEAFVSQCNAA